MKQRNFFLTILLSLAMIVGMGNWAKAQCPRCYTNPACNVEHPCTVYVLDVSMLPCTVPGLTAYTNDGCDVPPPCNTTDTTHINPGPNWYGNIAGMAGTQVVSNGGLSYIVNDCGCFCVDGFSWNSGAGSMDLASGTVIGNNLIAVSTSCCPSGFVEIDGNGPSVSGFCPTGYTCPPTLGYVSFTIKCH